jgi:hypothetical protein
MSVHGKLIPAKLIGHRLVPENPKEIPPEPPYTGPVCTYCGGTKFYEGPSGGLSTNILCANKDCRHWFNWHCGIIPMDDLNRVERRELESRATMSDDEAPDYTFEICGVPLSEIGLQDCYVVYPDGHEEPFKGFVQKPGQTVEEAIESSLPKGCLLKHRTGP